MRAARLDAPGRFVVTERSRPQCGPGDVVVRVRICGICTGELDAFEGKATGLTYPRFLGHEVSGVVAEVGPGVGDLREGQRVVLYAEGEGYADYIRVPREWVVPLPDEISFEHAIGEPIACSVNGVRKANPQLNDSVAIVGCGFMGLIMLQVFLARGAGPVIAVDRRADMLDLARKLGASHVVNTSEVDAETAVRDLTGGEGVDIGVEAAGVQQTLDLTSRLVRMEGKLEVFGFHQGGKRQVDWAHWNWMAFQIINGHSRAPEIYVEGIKIGVGLMESGKLNMTPLVTHGFDLEAINEGFSTAARKGRGFVKGFIACG